MASKNFLFERHHARVLIEHTYRLFVKVALVTLRLDAQGVAMAHIGVVRGDPVSVVRIQATLRLQLLSYFLHIAHGSTALGVGGMRRGPVEGVRRAHAATCRKDVHHVELVEVGLIVLVQVIPVAHAVHRIVFAPTSLRNWHRLLDASRHLTTSKTGRVSLNLVKWVVVAHHVGLPRDLAIEDGDNVVGSLEQAVLGGRALVEFALSQLA
mmetsp:Transcript_5237/g.6415  ORF Transcript_5237/g.6415 Transcript_5237/m.6415 type:complete len:210 (-) Transcript_5237:1242-1871(-)